MAYDLPAFVVKPGEMAAQKLSPLDTKDTTFDAKGQRVIRMSEATMAALVAGKSVSVLGCLKFTLLAPDSIDTQKFVPLRGEAFFRDGDSAGAELLWSSKPIQLFQTQSTIFHDLWDETSGQPSRSP